MNKITSAYSNIIKRLYLYVHLFVLFKRDVQILDIFYPIYIIYLLYEFMVSIVTILDLQKKYLCTFLRNVYDS